MLVFACHRIGYYGLIQHTSFLNDFPDDDNAGARFRLSPIGFYIGGIVLFLCMWITIITYIVFFYSIQMNRRIKHSLINTFFSIAMLTFLFCTGIYQTENYKVCQIFGLLIHYFSLCVLFWICVSVSHMYKRISRNDRISMESDLPREELHIKKPIMGMYLVGYGISCIICGINSAINIKDYASYYHCFGSQALSAFYVPASILLFFLVIMFICIRFHLRTRTVPTYMSEGTTEHGDIDLLEVNNDPGVARSVRSVTTSSNIEDLEHSPRTQLKSFITVLVLYMTTWISGSMAVSTPFSERLIYEEEVFSITFAVSGSILGLFVLYFYGFARSDVRNIWTNLRCYYIQQDNTPKESSGGAIVSGSVFYHAPMSTMSRSSSMNSRYRKSVDAHFLKSVSELNSHADSKITQNGANFLLLHRQQNSVYGDDSSNAEVFYNQNQINVARRFFKKQKRLQKLNNIDVRRIEGIPGTSASSTNHLSYNKPAVNDMFGSGSKVNNTNIHVEDRKNDCKTKFSNPNILSDSCNESELFMDIYNERLRFSTLKSKINNTDAVHFANIYTNVPETQQPIHEVVTMRADEKFNREVINNLNSPVEKNANPPLYVNARNILDETEAVEEIYTNKESLLPEDPDVSIEANESLLRINSPIEAMNTVGLPETEVEKTEEEKLQLKPEEEYISAPLEISDRSFFEVKKGEPPIQQEEVQNELQKCSFKSKSLDNLDTSTSSHHDTQIRSISFNNITSADQDMFIVMAPSTSTKEDYNPQHMTSSLMINHESQSPILISPSMCDIGDEDAYSRSMIDDDEMESNFTASNDTVNESNDDLLNSTTNASNLECTPIFLNPDNTPNFSIFNSSNLYDSAPSPTNFSDINYQNSELSIRSQDLYAPQLDNDLNMIMAEREKFHFNISDDEEAAENGDDTFNDSCDYLIQPEAAANGITREVEGEENDNEKENLLKDSQTSIDELYEQIKRKASMRPPIAPKPSHVKLNRNFIFKNGNSDDKI